MNDLISRQAAVDVLDAYQVMVENGEENPYAWAMLRMRELPSAQAEIVRCDDCKFGEKGRIFDSDCIWCGVDHNAKPMRFYCASGERREDDLLMCANHYGERREDDN